MLRALDTHDTATDWEMRSECLLGHDGMELAQVMNYAVDGVPMVYCGNELADEARLSMFANRFYMGEFEVTDRNQKNTAESLRRQELFKKLNQLCKTCDVITRGTTTWVENSCPEKVISFARGFEGKRVLFVGNASNTDVEVSIPEKLTGGKVFLQNGCEITDSSVQMVGHGYVLIEV